MVQLTGEGYLRYRHLLGTFCNPRFKLEVVCVVAMETRDESLCSLLAARAVPVLGAIPAVSDGGNSQHETKLILDVIESLEGMV